MVELEVGDCGGGDGAGEHGAGELEALEVGVVMVVVIKGSSISTDLIEFVDGLLAAICLLLGYCHLSPASSVTEECLREQQSGFI